MDKVSLSAIFLDRLGWHTEMKLADTGSAQFRMGEAIKIWRRALYILPLPEFAASSCTSKANSKRAPGSIWRGKCNRLVHPFP